ncbi:methyl-accepting chemotaxis protein [Colwelliaceae bacterium 6471]
MNAFWGDLSIQKKLVIAMAMALVLSSGLLTYFSNYFTKNIIEKRLETNELPSIMSNIRLNIEKEISTAITGSMQISENQFIISWLTQNEPESFNEGLQSYLSRLNKANGADETFVGSVTSGNYFTQQGLIKTMSKSEPLDGWFYKFFSDGLPYDTGIGPNKDTGELTLFINYLIKDNNVPLGVAGMGVSMQKLVDFVNNFKIGKLGKVFVVSKEGIIKIHSNQQFVDKTNISSLPGLSELKDKLLSQKSFYISEMNRDGEDYFVASDHISELDWYVVAEIPQSEVFGALSDVTRNSVLVTVIVISIFVFISIAVARGISAPILEISEKLRQIAQGDADLKQRLPETSNDELGSLAKSFNAFTSQLQGIITQIQTNCSLLLKSVAEVNGLSQTTSAELNEQKDRTMQVVTAVTEMGATIEELARNATETANAASDASEKVNEGSNVVQDTVGYIQDLSAEMKVSGTVINELAEHTVSIGSILSVIRGISEQTNLLALNAAIEAARAGEQGRGFAVVADEVRGLAQRTHTSTEEIQQMIEKLQEGSKNAVATIESGQMQTEKSVNASTKVGDALIAINSSVETIQGMSIQMATATEEQSVVVNDINMNIMGISDVTISTSEAAEKSSLACEQLRQLTEELDSAVSKFKV